MSDKALGHGTVVRHVCANCVFHNMEQMQGQIVRQMVCHRMPPTVSMVSTPQGVQGMTMFPIVQPQMWCFEWKSKDITKEPLLIGDKPGTGLVPCDGNHGGTPCADPGCWLR